MVQSFNELTNKIFKKAAKKQNTGVFDKLLLEGDNIQSIYNEVKKRGYERKGWFFSGRSFWGHIGVRIRDDNYIICVNNNEILQQSNDKTELNKYFEENVHIKLIGWGDDLKEACNNKNTDHYEKNGDWYFNVQKAMLDSPKSRRKRLSKALKKPNKSERKIIVFSRNPDVIAEVLLGADGICESCKQPAPFKRKSDSTPYLEVHHKIFLSDGGEDTVKNTIALCPNCHRFKHFGK